MPGRQDICILAVLILAGWVILTFNFRSPPTISSLNMFIIVKKVHAVLFSLGNVDISTFNLSNNTYNTSCELLINAMLSFLHRIAH